MGGSAKPILKPIAAISSFANPAINAIAGTGLVIKNQVDKQKEGMENAAKDAAAQQQALIDQQAAEQKAIGPKPTIDTMTDLEGQRRKRLQALRYGLLSTIKTSPLGLASSSSVNTPAAVAGGFKTKLGQ